MAICDAETTLDLSSIAEAGLQIPHKSIFVGSAGLAHQIAALWGPEQKVVDRIILADKPILVVVGSKSPVSRAQFDLLSNLSGMEILRIPATAFDWEDDPWLMAGLTRALAHGRDVGITTELNDQGDRQGAEMMRVLGHVLRRFSQRLAALVLTGGETARAILPQLEVARLQVIDEIESGVTLSIARGKPRLPVVMKAGAFGTPATLVNAMLFLRSCKKMKSPIESDFHRRPSISGSHRTPGLSDRDT